MPADGSEYPMAKTRSPLRMRGRKKSFCSALPNFMRVGPTVFSVTIETGAPAR